VVLALLGLLTLLMLLSPTRGAITEAWVGFLQRLSGWGAFFLPVALIAIGLWLVFRNIDRLPVLSTERLSGVILLYLNLLTWMNTLTRGGFELARNGAGGGMIGASFEWLLVSTVGFAGAVVALIAWLLIALAFTFDVSVPELFTAIQKAVQRERTTAGAGQTLSAPPVHPVTSSTPPPINVYPRQGAGTTPAPDFDEDEDTPASLPPSFQPLQSSTPEPQREARNQRGGRAAASTPAQASASANLPPSGTDASPTPAEAPTEPVWVLPAIEAILDPPTPQAVQASADHDRARLIEDTLKSFGAPGHVVEIHRGPTVTQFGVEPDFVESRSGRTRVRVAKIVSLADDLALALAAQRVRIQAPVPGRSYVGIEVPNSEVSRVTMREVIESDHFRRIKSPLRFALGKDVAGAPATYDLASMPHLLIAGTTGSGKSVCVNSILAAFLLHNSPADLRLVLVDPKRVELTNYNGIPHLLAPVVVEAEKVVNALQWMLREMDSRYHKFNKAGVRNIQEYNKRTGERLPYLLVVIDELADLMMLAPEETERSITRLAQLARATGIHLILATQRPSVEVITGLIKANFPARVAFAVASGIDSRVILDQPGAERLLGRGDMLFQAPDASAPVRLQGVYVSDSEIQRLVDFWRFSASRVATNQPTTTGSMEAGMGDLPRGVPLKQISFLEDPEEDGDPLLKEAIDLVRREGRASITMLQRRMRIGYTRAARLVDAMEEKGIIAPAQPNSQVREVLDYGPTAPPEDDGY